MKTRILGGICLFSVVITGFAASLGDAANNMLASVVEITQLGYSMCMILGAVLIGAAYIRYIEHRKNPVQVRFSTVIMFLILGIVTLLLPWLGSFSAGADSVKSISTTLPAS